MKIKLIGLSAILWGITFSSCKKEAGEGGTSSIQGRIFAHHLNGLQQWDTSYYDANTKVYIIYGTDHNTYDDDYTTSYDGSYEFKFLQKGTYRVFAYSADTTGLSQAIIDQNRPKIPILKTVEITSKNQKVQVTDLEIIKYN